MRFVFAVLLFCFFFPLLGALFLLQNPNKALWETGDFCLIAESIRETGAAIAKELAPQPLRVLDVGCGDGTTAIPFAQEGCSVVGLDIASNLVRAGNARAAELSLTEKCRFEEGDASKMVNTPSNEFDLVYTQFGAMFAPRPNDVAKELVRVAKPGGRIVMANWIAGDPTFASQLLAVSAKYSPPPAEGFVSPVLWGNEEVVRERFTAAGVANDDIHCERKTYWFVHKMSPQVNTYNLFFIKNIHQEYSSAFFSFRQELLRVFRNYFGPTMNAYDAAAKSGKQDELHAELEALFVRCNTATDGTTRIPATYLRVTVNKK